MYLSRVHSSRRSLRPSLCPQLVAGVMLTLTSLALPRAAALSGTARRLSAQQMSGLHGLAATLIQRNPALASGIAEGKVSFDTRKMRSVDDMSDALLNTQTPLRLRGGYAAPPVPAARAPAPPTASSARLSSRVTLGLKAMARGGVFGASRAHQLHTTQRLRGGNAQCLSMAAGSKSVDAHVDLPLPACVTEGDEMAPQYNPTAVEEPLYKWWESSGFFKPSEYKKGEKKSYVLPMPPPNVTGGLHMGHAMFVALQDILARYHRMKGEPTLWLPGTDHAGIATQLLVERSLNAQGINRYDLGRDKFLEKVWEWKGEKGGYITEQLRRLGASADWSRERFTMDDGLSDAVAEAFVQLHDKGLVYRGEYMVNWSPNLRTAVSDLEVEYSDEEGKLYFFKYPLAGGGPDDFLPVATTRPETIMGDTAVCVHPEDPRYQKFIGKMVKVPRSDREIPVIADDYVDREFGTGCLKITPGHDPNDYELGKKYSLPTINIMNLDASLNDKCGEYEGLDRFEAREKLWADMEKDGLVIEVKPHMQRVPRSQRGGEVIEPLVSTQWFIKTKGMAEKALDAVKTGEMKIIPQRFEKTWFNWLDNIHDWCVSRQLWWGHRIPVWHIEGTGVFPVTTEYVVARNEAEAYQKAKASHGADVSLKQDMDVLDTWFSSGLWPFSTVGWPNGAELDAKDDPTSDLTRFYKEYGSSCLETGYDILFFWVARMVMLGTELTGKVPFDVVYMHGLVRDAQGKKMSKTTGNVVDPLDVIAEYGTDALRYTLVTGVTPGLDVPLDPKRIESNRNFANKLWNSARFILSNLKDLSPEEKQGMAVTGPMTSEEMSKLAMPERFIVSQCHQLVADVTLQLDEYTMGQAGDQIQTFLWDQFADWYLETSKVRIFAAQKSDDPEVQAAAQQARRVLLYVLDTNLRLLHPFMPYVTEAIWQRLPHVGKSLVIASWPQQDATPLHVDQEALRQFGSLQELVRTIRNARNEYKVEPGRKIQALIAAEGVLGEELKKEGAALAAFFKADPELLQIRNLADTRKALDGEKGLQPVHLVVQDGLEAFLPMSGLVDMDKELARLSKQQGTLEKDVEGLDARLSAPGYKDKAPPAVVEKAEAELADKREQMKTVTESIDSMLGQMSAEDAKAWREKQAAEKAAAAEAARIKAEAAAIKKAEAAAKKAEKEAANKAAKDAKAAK